MSSSSNDRITAVVDPSGGGNSPAQISFVDGEFCVVSVEKNTSEIPITTLSEYVWICDTLNEYPKTIDKVMIVDNIGTEYEHVKEYLRLKWKGADMVEISPMRLKTVPDGDFERAVKMVLV